MASKKQNKSAVTGSARVLRPRTPTGDSKDDGRGTVKVPKASGKLKAGDAGKGDIVMKRKLTDDESACSRAKILKAMHKTEMDKGASGATTRVLRSSGKKENGAAKEVVDASAKTCKGSCSFAADFTGPESSGKRVTRSASKGQVQSNRMERAGKLLRPNNHMK